MMCLKDVLKIIYLISSGLGLQQLEMGLGFPARDWTGSWQWKDQILAIRPVVRDKGSDPSALEKRISTKMGSSEASEEFFRKKKSTLHVDTHTGRFRGRVPELRPSVSLSYFYVVFPPGFLWPIILTCLVHSPYLMYLRNLPGVHMHLLAKMNSTAKAYG